MKKLIAILFILAAKLTFAQTQQFICDYISVPDSTQKEVSHSEITVLNICKTQSEYFSMDRFLSDSTLLEDSKKGLISMPTNKTMSSDRVNKNANSDKITFVSKIGWTKYFVDETLNYQWKLHPEYISILNYKAQKATTDFGGRKWIAWFAKDIPFQDGPYKFKGLPGLIVKIEDETKSHQFELKGIKNIEDDFIYPELNNYKRVDLPYKKFIKAYQNYRESPAADMVGKFTDQTDSEGNFKKGIEIFREFEKQRIEDVEKDNNIIEIDLIKK